MHHHRCIPLIKSYIDTHFCTCHTVEEIVRRFNIDRHVLHEQLVVCVAFCRAHYFSGAFANAHCAAC